MQPLPTIWNDRPKFENFKTKGANLITEWSKTEAGVIHLGDSTKIYTNDTFLPQATRINFPQHLLALSAVLKANN